MKKLLSEHIFGDMCARYQLDESSGIVALELLPLGFQGSHKPKKQALEPLVQLMVRGDDFPGGFSNGHTMRGSGSICRFRYKDQQVIQREGHTEVITSIGSADNQEISHKLVYYVDVPALEITTTYSNNGSETVTLDMLSSFGIGGITPFIADDAPESMILHRLRSKWSNEARLDSVPIEDLQLEPTWSGHGAFSEKFGQVGSMPVRKFFPFAAVEDTQSHILWGAQLACPSSWQIEVYRRDDGLSISGGLADYDFGHWCKDLHPGESFTAPIAAVTVCEGDFDRLCARLVSMQARALEKMKHTDYLPVIYNEFCTTWGNPTQQNIERILNVIKDRDMDYFVIDSGWYADEVKGWEMSMGDWEVNTNLFPGGLSDAVNAIRNAGLKPGIWFEAEVCGCDAKAFQLTKRLLSRHGIPITAGFRRFWDMRDEWVNNYLDEKVIGLLEQYGFDYVKIDYNESIGIGCDGAESFGEGLRQSVLASRDFLTRIREKIPGIVVENCASGGHRLEPSLLGVCQLASFSDAHEEFEIPIIAANLHYVMLPRQSLIWAVLRKDDSLERLYWSLSATFLGVMCLSGDVYDLSAQQWEIVKKAIAFYRKVSPVIMNGITKRHGPKVSGYRHPKGWQVIERTSPNGCAKLIVVHVFDETDTNVCIDLCGEYHINEVFSGETEVCVDGRILSFAAVPRCACALYLERKN